MSSNGGATTTSSPKGAVKLHGQLRSSGRVLDRLTSQHLDHLVASRRSGDAISRDSLASLYSLATRLHSPALRFASPSIETSKERHITTEQVWGQLNMLMRPVLRQLEASVLRAEKMYGDDATKSKAEAKKKAAQRQQQLQRKKKAAATSEEDSDDEDLSDVGDSGAAATAILSTRTSELDESDMDEEIAALLQKQAAKKKTKSKEAKKDGDDADTWRYAFGKGNLDDDDDDEDENDWDGEDSDHGTSRRRRREEAEEEDGEGQVGEDREDGSRGDRGGRRARDRNQRAMADAEDEEEEEGGDADEELAALKELYGEDFEDDGQGFLGDEEEEDPDLAEDIELDDPGNERAGGFNERDGIYFGKGDILNDEAGDFAEGQSGFYGDEDGEGEGDELGNAGGHPGEEEEEVDEELEAALLDPTLSELQRERLREQHMVRKMEEKRLFGTDWSMTGETAATKRPRDALLEVDDLEFEYGMKATPVVTEAFTAKLEDRIKQRIQDENFDDVQRRTTLSTEADIAKPKYDAALDAQKSKMSLMDLYEKDFLEKQRLAEDGAGGPDAPSAEPLTEVEKDELRAVQMWQRLAQHLDALSNFHFTPKPVQQDLDARVRAVENQAPAVVIESVGNFATTRENALAPQDLYRGSSHRFADVGTEELTPQERHALRRSKKEAGKKDLARKEDRAKQSKEARKKKTEAEATEKK